MAFPDAYFRMRNGEESMARSRAYTVGNNGWIRSNPIMSRSRTTVQSGNNKAKIISASCTIQVKRRCPLIAPIALSIDALETTMKQLGVW